MINSSEHSLLPALQSLMETAVQKHRLGQLDEAELSYRQFLQFLSDQAIAPNRLENLPLILIDFGNVLLKQGKSEEAIQAYENALQHNPHLAEAQNNLATILRRQGRLEEAAQRYQVALSINPNLVEGYKNLGNVFHLLGKLEDAAQAFQQALILDPQLAMVYYSLGNVLKEQNKLEEAAHAYQQTLALNPQSAKAYNNLGTVLKEQGKLEEAGQSYQQALALDPQLAEVYNNLGILLQEQDQFEAAIQVYQQALALTPQSATIHNNFGTCLLGQGKLEDAAQAYQRAIALDANLVDAYYNLGNIFKDQGKLTDALQVYEQALAIDPKFALAEFGICVSQLPIVYSAVDEIQDCRDRYQQHLQRLVHRYQTASPDERAHGATAVGAQQPFFLTYQGVNDRPLQQIYGTLMCLLMSSRYPQWSQSLVLPQLAPQEKIRVGFVSGFFRDHSNWKIPIRGWVENLDRTRFELFGYHTSATQDSETMRAAQAFDTFCQGPLPLQHWCQLIRHHQVHILIFPEFGMDPVTANLGCLRLAPIQITSWGHPTTSGLPTIDYYLSSDLMEPEHAQEHYTETLVRLPDLSIYYTPLDIQPRKISKQMIGIDQETVVFWCCQSLYKYLPQHDDVFPQIANAVGNCKFVFIKYFGDRSEILTETFSQRLDRAFKTFGLHADDYCIGLSRLDSSTFAGVTAMADVFLDSIGWSGCNSALEAIAHDLPIVTLPGDLMRARHTTAILKMMGVEETIATNKEDYVKLATHLGQDSTYRQSISQEIRDNKHKLYRDLKPIRALEKFFENLFLDA